MLDLDKIFNIQKVEVVQSIDHANLFAALQTLAAENAKLQQHVGTLTERLDSVHDSLKQATDRNHAQDAELAALRQGLTQLAASQGQGALAAIALPPPPPPPPPVDLSPLERRIDKLVEKTTLLESTKADITALDALSALLKNKASAKDLQALATRIDSLPPPPPPPVASDSGHQVAELTSSLNGQSSRLRSLEALVATLQAKLETRAGVTELDALRAELRRLQDEVGKMQGDVLARLDKCLDDVTACNLRTDEVDKQGEALSHRMARIEVEAQRLANEHAAMEKKTSALDKHKADKSDLNGIKEALAALHASTTSGFSEEDAARLAAAEGNIQALRRQVLIVAYGVLVTSIGDRAAKAMPQFKLSDLTLDHGAGGEGGGMVDGMDVPPPPPPSTTMTDAAPSTPTLSATQTRETRITAAGSRANATPLTPREGSARVAPLRPLTPLEVLHDMLLKGDVKEKCDKDALKKLAKWLDENAQFRIDGGSSEANGGDSLSSLADLVRRLQREVESMRKPSRDAAWSARNKMGLDGDFAMLSSKPLSGYRCMSCDRPLDKLSSSPGVYVVDELYPTRRLGNGSRSNSASPERGGGGVVPPTGSSSRPVTSLGGARGETAAATGKLLNFEAQPRLNTPVIPTQAQRDAHGLPMDRRPNEAGPILPPGGWRGGGDHAHRDRVRDIPSVTAREGGGDMTVASPVIM